MGTKPSGHGNRGSAYDGFNVSVKDEAVLWTPPGGESRKLRFGIDPEVKAKIKQRPELLEVMIAQEMLLWMDRMEEKGYRLVSKHSTPYRTPSPDPNEAGWDWCIIEAKWKHDGPVSVEKMEGVERFQAERQAIGAGQSKTSTGVERYLKQAAADNGGTLPEGLTLGGDKG